MEKSFSSESFFRVIVDFEAANEIDISKLGKKTTNIYKKNPVVNGYIIESELEDVLKNGYDESPLGYNIVDWFVDEVMKLEIEMNF